MPLNNKVIAKNTMMLYIRMLLIMAVSLYTTRVVLATLGVDDYGLYSLIGGFISLFYIISNSLVSTLQRFFNVALGENNEQELGRLYSMGIILLALLSLCIVVIAETVGLWFVSTKLNIPEGRETAAFWVYQISVFTLIAQLFRTPDNAAIIAYERMGFFALLSVLEAVLKLTIVFLLGIFSFDKLILYTFLYFLSTVVINLAYKLYCRLKFSHCRFHLLWDRKIYKGMVSFSWWTLVGEGTQLGTIQGENFLLNHYYSVSVNAARGVAAQVYNAINTVLLNFQTAFRPQLVKTYAAQQKDEHLSLLNWSARVSFCLMLALTIPVFFNLDVLLSVWLKEIPPYTKEFCLYVLLAYLIDAVSAPLAISISANGNIKKMQMVLSGIFLLQLLASFLALRSKAAPYIVSVFILVSHSLMFLAYLFFAKKLCAISVRDFSKNVLLPLSLTCALSFLFPLLLHQLSGGLGFTLVAIVLDAVWVVLISLFFALSKKERQVLMNQIRSNAH